jgi:nitrite reductase (NADH) small subunit
MMSQWLTLCSVEDILPGCGVCALAGEEQVALFRPYADEQIFALSNIDPFAQASVLSRGLIGEHQGELWVASPLKKQHFRLTDGFCMEDDQHSIPAYDVRVREGHVEISTASLQAEIG